MKITVMKLFVLALGSCLKPQDILHITSISYVFIAIKYSYRLHFMNTHLVITNSITTLLYIYIISVYYYCIFSTLYIIVYIMYIVQCTMYIVHGTVSVYPVHRLRLKLLNYC